MQTKFRLRENRDFRRVFQRGKSVATSRFVLYWYKTPTGHARVGFSISKKVGNAVHRNRLKRRLRAAFREMESILTNESIDFVVIARKGSADASYSDVQNDLRKLLKRAHFMV